MPSNKLLQAAAGSAGGDNLFVEDVFSTYLYIGTGSSPTITTGIDMLGEGGLVWNKNRTDGYANLLIDSERGVGKYSFTNTGYVLGTDMGVLNSRPSTYASWSWRKAKGWLDIVTYSGNYTAGTTIAHNLGSVPKMMLIKNTSGTGGGNRDWIVYHASLGGTKFLNLNLTASETTRAAEFNNTDPTSSVFTLGGGFNTNQTGESYVAYLFGDDAIFGEDGDEQICKIDSYTGNGNNTGPIINCGFEPQWILVKKTSSTGGNKSWIIVDAMRGIVTGGNDRFLTPNESSAEFDFDGFSLTATGFQVITSNDYVNTNGVSYIYMAIRKSMKVPEAGTEVYGGVSFAGNNATNRFHNLGVQVDLALSYNTDGFVGFTNRLLGGGSLYMPSTAGDANAYWSLPDWYALDFMNGYMSKTSYSYSNSASSSFYTLGFKTATGFLSVLAWSGQSNASYAVPHSLGVKPEIIIYKRRSSTVAPYIAETLTNKSGDFEAGNALTSSRFNTDFASTSPTNTQITVSNAVANTGDDLLAFLFASVSGVSKCGTFTGTGSSLDIDCGFSNGARFILIKRIDNSGGAYLFDYKQGITSGNSSYIVMNTNTAPVTNTDFVDPLSSGFNLTANGTSTVNISGATYLFLAIA